MSVRVIFFCGMILPFILGGDVVLCILSVFCFCWLK